MLLLRIDTRIQNKTQQLRLYCVTSPRWRGRRSFLVQWITWLILLVVVLPTRHYFSVWVSDLYFLSQIQGISSVKCLYMYDTFVATFPFKITHFKNRFLFRYGFNVRHEHDCRQHRTKPAWNNIDVNWYLLIWFDLNISFEVCGKFIMPFFVL